MRAFLGQFDRVSLGIFLVGAVIGVIWLVALDLGVVLAALAIPVGTIALIVRHRFIEIGLLVIGLGLVVQAGYGIFGVPPEPPIVYMDGISVPTEAFAPGAAGLLLVGGVLLTAVIGAWDMWEGRRRERLEERHRLRRARQLEGSD